MNCTKHQSSTAWAICGCHKCVSYRVDWGSQTIIHDLISQINKLEANATVTDVSKTLFGPVKQAELLSKNKKLKGLANGAVQRLQLSGDLEGYKIINDQLTELL